MSNYFEERNKKNLALLAEVRACLPAFCEEFFVGIQNRTSPLTRLNYAYDLRIFFEFYTKVIKKGGLLIDDITLSHLETISPFEIERFLDYLNSYTIDGKESSCSESAKERKLSTLRSFFKYYFNKDRIKTNPASKVDMPKVHQRDIIRLEVDEVVKLLNAVEDGQALTENQQRYRDLTARRDLAIMTLFLGTGIRISELVGLNRNDIDFESNSFRVTRKGGNQSLLYFSDEVAKALRDYIYWIEEEIEAGSTYGYKCRDCAALFISIQGKRLGVRAVENLVKKYAQIVSPLKKITPHKLRSTFGTALYRQTEDIYVVAEMLGHSDINTTRKHYAASADELRRAAARKIVLRDDD